MSKAPTGFKKEGFVDFLKSGICVLPQVFSPEETSILKRAAFAIKEHKAPKSERSFRIRSLARQFSLFSSLIDRPEWMGCIYDFYGEQTKLLSSELIVRPPQRPDAERNSWHYDGPRLLPFQLFSKIPLRIKVGVWLSESSSEVSSRFIYIPASHNQLYLEQYGSHEAHPQEVALSLKPGDVFMFAAGLWHRVENNTSAQSRVSLYYEYGPSWIQTTDTAAKENFVKKLSREQRILLREYPCANDHIKIPQSDYPLYEDAEELLVQKNTSGTASLQIHGTRAAQLLQSEIRP